MLCASLLLLGVGGLLYPGTFTVAFAAQALGVFCGIVVLDWVLEACLEEVPAETFHV